MNALDETLATIQPQGGNALDQTLAQIQTPQTTPAPLAWWQRVAKGVSDVNDAGAQMLVNAMPAPVVNAVNSATQAVNDMPVIGPITKALNMTPATAKEVNDTIAQREKDYQARRGDSGVDWYRLLGSSAVTAPLAAAMPGATGITGGAMSGALYGGISQPVTEGDYGPEKLKQMGVGAAVGGATSAGAEALARAISPTIDPQARQLMNEGVNLTPGQIMGGGAKRVEDAATSIPVLGDTIKNAQRRSFQDLNTAAINRSLSPINDKLPAGMTGREAIDYANSRLSDAYDSVLGRMGAIHPDPQFASDMAQLGSMTQNLPQSTADQFQRIVQNEVLDRIKNGVMTPEAMKSAESNLGNMVRGYGRSQDYDTRLLGDAIQQVQANLRSMVQRVAPANLAGELQAINQGYANFLRPQRAASMLGADGGVFTPDQLQSAIRALDPSKNKGSFARGDALMQDLSEAGKSVMGNKVPDSGTPLRHAVQGGLALAAGHSVFPGADGAAAALAAAAGVGALPYTQMGQKLAAALLTKRPAGAQITADELRALAPLLGAVSVPAIQK